MGNLCCSIYQIIIFFTKFIIKSGMKISRVCQLLRGKEVASEGGKNAK